MTFTPRVRKLALTAHVVASVGWLGAAVAYLALAVAALASSDGDLVRAAYLAFDATARFAIVPLAFASLVTGIVQALGTTWGLFRHYWVVVKLALTILATAVLLLHLPTVSHLAAVAQENARPDRGGLGGEAVHAGGGVAVLLAAAVLAVFKPRGLTAYGRRKQRGEQAVGA